LKFNIDKVLISCEHASNAVPEIYRRLFPGKEALLATHAAYDIGARELARAVAARLGASLHEGEITRMLVDLNRSMGNRKGLFTAIASPLTAAEKEEIISHHYLPYRQGVESSITGWLDGGKRVGHISIHTFTSFKDGKARCGDIGILYDPARETDKLFSRRLKESLRKRRPEFIVKMNYPYLGISDGLVPSLRKCYPPESYLGIELEVNQKFPEQGGDVWGVMKEAVSAAIAEVTGN